MLTTQHHTHVFSVYIFGNQARLIRWSRECIAYTAAFDYRLQSDILAEFLYAYSLASRGRRGWDNSVSYASAEEETLLRIVARRYGKHEWRMESSSLASCHADSPVYKITVSTTHEHPEEIDDYAPNWGPEDPGTCTFIFKRPFWGSQTELLGRNTRAFLAVDRKTESLVVLKDSWRASHMNNEQTTYETLMSKEYPEREFLPKTIYATDVIHDGAAGSGFAHQRIIQELAFTIDRFENSKELVQAFRDMIAGEFLVGLQLEVVLIPVVQWR